MPGIRYRLTVGSFFTVCDGPELCNAYSKHFPAGSLFTYGYNCDGGYLMLKSSSGHSVFTTRQRLAQVFELTGSADHLNRKAPFFLGEDEI